MFTTGFLLVEIGWQAGICAQVGDEWRYFISLFIFLLVDEAANECFDSIAQIDVPESCQPLSLTHEGRVYDAREYPYISAFFIKVSSFFHNRKRCLLLQKSPKSGRLIIQMLKRSGLLTGDSWVACKQPTY